jgi:hexosaminidase
MKYFSLMTLLLGFTTIWCQLDIIPQPQSIIVEKSGMAFTPIVILPSKGEMGTNNQLFTKELIQLGFDQKSKAKGKVNLQYVLNSALPQEAYTLTNTNGKVILAASDKAGQYNGLQTLRQILDQAQRSNFINNFSIKDEPTYKWRGLMLDVSRHFFGVDDVKKYIDVMARYKYNVLHWHLTDDEGWRIQINKYPKLTEVGAYRAEGVGRYGNRAAPVQGSPTPYGGFYTQAQIKDVVAYAAQKNITIVPEVDVPGHSMALLAAYPELSVKNEPKMVSNGFKFAEWFGNGTFKMLVENTIDPSDEKVYEFLDNVLTEVASLFPGKYIHIGGDEAYHGYWEEDPTCKAFMQKNNLKNTEELQSYFMRRMEKIIASKGKTMIGWDEILHGGIADGAAVMSWRGMSGGIEAAKAGHDVVMTPTTFCYLDYTQGDPSLENPIYASLSLKKTYEFNPLPEGIDPKYILGGQGNLWSEQIPNIDNAFLMTYPRALSISETLWSGEKNKNWDRFTSKLPKAIADLQSQKISVSTSYIEPEVTVTGSADKPIVNLSSSVKDVVVRYTTDHTLPVASSTSANGPIDMSLDNVMLKAASFKNGMQVGRTIMLTVDDLKKRIKK